METILLTGATIIDDGIKEKLKSVYDIIECENTKESIQQETHDKDIDLILMCIGDKLVENVNLYKCVTKYKTKKETAIFALGSKERCEELNKVSNVTEIKGMFYKPIEEEELLSGIEKYWADLRKEEKIRDVFGGNVEILDDIDIEEEKKEERKKVLIVDDDIKVLKLLSSYLEKMYDVAIAKKGETALKYLKSKTSSKSLKDEIPDIILLDYVMPDVNGGEVFKKMRNNPKLKDIPVFFLTGVADVNTVRNILMLQPQGYLLKPIKKEDLLEKLDTYWNSQK